MITTVLFDLDDTLYDFHLAEAKAVATTLEELGVTVTDKVLSRYSELNDAQWKLLEQGKLTRDEVKKRRFRLLFEELQVEIDDALAAKTYEGYLSKGHYFMEGALELLEELKEQYNLYLVSNGTAVVQHSRLDSGGIKPFFKEIFISEEIGANKPQKEFFDYCFQRIPNVKKEECVIIGDSLSSDMKGGIDSGIHTIWFCPRQQVLSKEIVPEVLATRLQQIPELLKRW